MAQTNTGGYQQTAYLAEVPYMGGNAVVTTGMQVNMVTDTSVSTGQQANMNVNAAFPLGMQADMFTGNDGIAGMQVEMFINDLLNPLGFQVDMLTSKVTPNGMQVDMQLAGNLNQLGMQAKMGFPQHITCGGYLTDNPYMEEAYLGPKFCTLNSMQVFMQISEIVPTGLQAEMFIVSPDDDKITGMQANMQIAGNLKITGMQADMLSVDRTGMQATMVLYSVETLRFLCDFESRGTPAQAGDTWTSVQSLRVGDFEANNLNTDIFEERTETLATPPALWELQCNTGKTNTFVDTIYIGDHNFTLGASVIFQASTFSNFSTIEYQRVMTVENQDMYFVLPLLDFPPLPAQYYRLLIQDGANPGALKIGIVVFGSSTTFTPDERFINPVRYGVRHFKDTIPTEGFTNVSNDRALRKFLTLDFEQLLLEGGNFGKIRNFIKTSKTDLKCLIIPRPTKPSALAVFSKLTTLPEEQHYATEDDNWRIDLTLDWDEQD